MSDAHTDAFLSGQGIPVALREVEPELARLWGPAAEREGGPEPGGPDVTRLALATLIVVGPRADGVLDTVVARHPCRAIVVRATADRSRRVAAEVSALCQLPVPGRPQVCSERIVLGAGPEAGDLLPGAVRPLVLADLPVVLWWAEDPRARPDLFRALAAESTRLIVDLPDPLAEPEALRAALDPAVHPFARDLAWFGITPWREQVAQFFDQPESADLLGRIDRVTIDAAAADGRRTPRVAAWLVAWLAGQLRWQARSKATADGRLAVEYEGPGGPIGVEVRLATEPDREAPEVRGIALTTRGPAPATFRVARSPDRPDAVEVVCEARGRCPLPRLVHIPEFDAARRVAAALESARLDPPARDALPHLLWLLDA